VEAHRRRKDPYREPSPPEEGDRAVPTCEEMRRGTGPETAFLLAFAACAIAWMFVGH
jgi:hypothetical protein